VPELPEMQALSERLDALLAGSSLAGFAPLQFSAAKTFDPPADSLVGRTLDGLGRRGKYLIFDFGGPRLLIHLSQGGRIDVEQPPKTTRPKGAVLRLVFEERPSLLIKEYGTQRKAGWWVIPEGSEGPMEVLGPEPTSPEFEDFILHGTDRRRIHTILRDQRTVAGIGRGYSDDILHRGRISPYTSLASLTDDERRALLDAIRFVLEEGLASERKRTGGLPPKLSGRFNVHGKAGQPCPRCGAELRRVSYEDYEIAYCPECQTEGRILADRRLSRIVK
jgi:formamidopyrimidine-DNA glycosylase